MRLSARPLVNFANVNSFSYANQWIVRAGEPVSLWFQLVDLDQGPSNVIGQPFSLGTFAIPSTLSGNTGLRYVAGVGSANQPFQVAVTFPSIDNTKILTVIAVPDPNDASIFKVSLGANQIVQSGNVQFAVTEGTATRRFNSVNAIAVEYPLDSGSC